MNDGLHSHSSASAYVSTNNSCLGGSAFKASGAGGTRCPAADFAGLSAPVANSLTGALPSGRGSEPLMAVRVSGALPLCGRLELSRCFNCLSAKRTCASCSAFSRFFAVLFLLPTAGLGCSLLSLVSLLFP